MYLLEREREREREREVCGSYEMHLINAAFML
jgi:hypothetical protein